MNKQRQLLTWMRQGEGRARLVLTPETTSEEHAASAARADRDAEATVAAMADAQVAAALDVRDSARRHLDTRGHAPYHGGAPGRCGCGGLS